MAGMLKYDELRKSIYGWQWVEPQSGQLLHGRNVLVTSNYHTTFLRIQILEIIIVHPKE